MTTKPDPTQDEGRFGLKVGDRVKLTSAHPLVGCTGEVIGFAQKITAQAPKVHPLSRRI